MGSRKQSKINSWSRYFSGLAILLLLSACGPVAKFSAPNNSLTVPARIAFENQSKHAETYQWKIDGELVSESAELEHAFNRSGNYEVELIAMKGKKQKSMKETIQVKAPENCMVEIQTEYGNMIAELYDATPQHRDNFIKLVEKSYYDDLIFHRIINGFMIQGGDPMSRNAPVGREIGNGGPGYTVPNEMQDSLVHIKGALCAARQPDYVNPKKASSGSQFYIVHGKSLDERTLDIMENRKGIRYTKAQREAYIKNGGTPILDREYTVFGRVVAGLEVIDKIAIVQTKGKNRPVQDIKMKIVVVQ